MLNSTSPMIKKKKKKYIGSIYTCKKTECGMNSFWHQTRERRNREGWEAEGTLQEQQELSRSKEPVSNTVQVPLHFNRCRAVCGCSGLPADHYTAFTATLSENFCLKTKGTIRNNRCHHIHLASWPRAAQGSVG